MKTYTALVVLLSVSSVFSKKVKAEKEEEENELAHGFGDDIDWVPWNDAISQAKELNKPVFLIIHKSWCGACQALKTTFRVSTKRKDFVKLSKKFVMVNTEDDDEPEDEKFAPDGRYIPRIFFLDSDGDVIEGVDNKKQYPSNMHYFAQIPDLINAMKKALKAFSKAEKSEEKVAKDEDLQEAGELKSESEKEKEEDEEPPVKAKKCPYAKAPKKEKAKKDKKAKKEDEVIDEDSKEVKKSKEKEEETKVVGEEPNAAAEEQKEEKEPESQKEESDKAEGSESKEEKKAAKKKEKKEKKQKKSSEKEKKSKSEKKAKTEL